jgi:ubiquinone/menaquinone biosynthesis C-methylase UbiE
MAEIFIQCPLCSDRQVENLRVYRFERSTFSDLSLKSCTNCELVFADPMPSQHSLDQYNISYFDNAHGGVAKDIMAQSFFSAIALSRMADIETYAFEHEFKIENILEIGPGAGKLAWHWLNKYPSINYMAIEPDKDCHSFLIETGVKLLDKSELENTTSYDLLIMSHVVEHVIQPYDFIKQYTQFLKPNGIIFLEVPCNDYLHKDIDEPHLLFFDIKAMRILLSRLGFTKIQLKYRGKSIDSLISKNAFTEFWEKIRLKMIKIRFFTGNYFSTKSKTTDKDYSLLEKRLTSIYKLNGDSTNPAWWLRSIGTVSSAKESLPE